MQQEQPTVCRCGYENPGNFCPDCGRRQPKESVVGNPDLHGLHMVQDQEHIPDHIFVLNEDRSFSMDSHHFTSTVEEFAAFIYPQVFAREEKAAEGHPPEPEEAHSH